MGVLDSGGRGPETQAGRAEHTLTWAAEARGGSSGTCTQKMEKLRRPAQQVGLGKQSAGSAGTADAGSRKDSIEGKRRWPWR